MYRGIRLEVTLVKDTVLDSFELFEGFHDGSFLAHMDLVGPSLDVFDRLVLIVQLFRLEIRDSSRGPISESTGVIDNRGCPLLVLFVILSEVAVESDKLARLVVTVLAPRVPHVAEIVSHGASIPRHLQLLVNFIHDELEVREEIFVYHVLFETFHQFLFQFFAFLQIGSELQGWVLLLRLVRKRVIFDFNMSLFADDCHQILFFKRHLFGRGQGRGVRPRAVVFFATRWAFANLGLEDAFATLGGPFIFLGLRDLFLLELFFLDQGIGVLFQDEVGLLESEYFDSDVLGVVRV